ncbi:D-TA family PLP-dependent enzyme [Methylobacterium iners]|uniref:D-threonine aldolase n=1 Tax=Methylobacterium iners TaxID=418707 RepID=A0ABQ4S4Z7_9HYPH|nr:D-TA family PLP-dependent enzyme [Methylobacterium iners]GJD97996.1 D-threonine aldolase [Methylobacterium iners]
MTRLADTIAREFGTPAVVVDLDVVEANVTAVQALCDRLGLANRPHIKTHKSPELAKLQVETGAQGITCQKLGEAEVMVEAGLNDILISYNILGEQKLRRLGTLLERARITVAADSATTIDGLATCAALASQPLPVVVECDTGMKRAGVETPGEAVALSRRIAATAGLTFAGLLFYPPPDGWERTQRFLDTVSSGLHEAGLTLSIVSTGGSPNLAHLGALRGATEHRPGTYIFNDRMQMAAGVATLADCALTVYATVVSRASDTRGIVDAGSKTLTSDPGGLDGFGLILDYPKARIAQLSEEHGFLDLAGCDARPLVGEVVRIIPNHVCVVVNMVDRLIAVRGERIVGEIAVAARGRTV